MSSKRSPEMQKTVDAFAKSLFGRSATDARKSFVCVTCGKPVEGFRDDLSRKEYQISGMCQECQDSVFGGEDDGR